MLRGCPSVSAYNSVHADDASIPQSQRVPFTPFSTPPSTSAEEPPPGLVATSKPTLASEESYSDDGTPRSNGASASAASSTVPFDAGPSASTTSIATSAPATLPAPSFSAAAPAEKPLWAFSRSAPHTSEGACSEADQEVKAKAAPAAAEARMEDIVRLVQVTQHAYVRVRAAGREEVGWVSGCVHWCVSTLVLRAWLHGGSVRPFVRACVRA